MFIGELGLHEHPVPLAASARLRKARDARPPIPERSKARASAAGRSLLFWGVPPARPWGLPRRRDEVPDGQRVSLLLRLVAHVEFPRALAPRGAALGAADYVGVHELRLPRASQARLDGPRAVVDHHRHLVVAHVAAAAAAAAAASGQVRARLSPEVAVAVGLERASQSTEAPAPRERESRGLDGPLDPEP